MYINNYQLFPFFIYIEKTIVHDLFMKMACKDQYSFAPKFKPENSIWMEDTKLKNLIICHQEVSDIVNYFLNNSN